MRAERTERPTQRRRQKARRRGTVARSREVASALVLLALGALLAWNPGVLLSQWKQFFRVSLDAAVSRDTFDTLAAGPLLSSFGWTMFVLSGLFLIAIWFVAVLGMVAQEGMVFAADPVRLRAERLSPAENLRKLFSLAALARTLQSFLPVAALLALVGALLVRDWPLILSSTAAGWASAVRMLFSVLMELMWKAALLFLAWAGVDYMLQRWHHEQGLRMTKQEQRDEQRESEGPPEIRNRQRRLRNQLRQRSLSST